MSEKVLNQDRTAELWAAVKEYADGRPGGSAGSSGEVYSTEETRIGTWINGKPLYRQFFIGNVGSPINASDNRYLFNFDTNNVIRIAFGYVVEDKDGNTQIPIPSRYFGIYRHPSENGIIGAHIGTDRYDGCGFVIAFAYTKVSDVIGGGPGEIFISEETKIGKWIDGKPLYRQFFRGKAGSYNSNQANAILFDFDINCVIRNSFGYFERDVYGNTECTIPSIYAGICRINGGATVGANLIDARFSNQPFTLALEYTKTTD